MAATPLTASKTPNIIVTEIKMMSSAFKGGYFLVEGDDDSKFWKAHIPTAHASIVICEGKPNLLGATQIIYQQGLFGVAGVYDPDFEHLFGVIHFPSFLTPTDENDLELTLLASRALELLLHEYADENKLRAFEASHGITAVAQLENMSKEFGKLRLLSKKLGHNVDFDRLSPYRFVSQNDWVLDIQGLHAEYARLAGIPVEQLRASLTAAIPTAKSWGLCQGHDAIRILAQGLRKSIGRTQISEQDLAKVLRIAYSREMLQQSQMYKALKALEEKMPGPIFD